MKNISIEAAAATFIIIPAPLHDGRLLRRRFRSDSPASPSVYVSWCDFSAWGNEPLTYLSERCVELEPDVLRGLQPLSAEGVSPLCCDGSLQKTRPCPTSSSSRWSRHRNPSVYGLCCRQKPNTVVIFSFAWEESFHLFEWEAERKSAHARQKIFQEDRLEEETGEVFVCLSLTFH